MQSLNDYGLVADLYDTYVPATFDIDFFVKEAAKCPGEILELMSGTGRVSIPLVEAGARLTCVDISEEMNAVLRAKLAERGLRADIHTMDVRDLDLGKSFDQVIIPFNSFAHIISTDDQRRVLQRIHQHLSPGGRFICTLGNPAIRRQDVDGRLRLYRKYDLGEQGTLLLWLLEKIRLGDERVVETLEFFEAYDRQGALQSKRLMELQFCLTTREELEALAHAAGFEVAAFFGDYNYSDFHEEVSPYMIWLLDKS